MLTGSHRLRLRTRRLAPTLFVVSRILGYTSVATTAGFYGHVQPSMLRRSADRMDELMRKASGT
jgi:hypothetical protein